MMNFGKKIAVGVASAALVASMGAMAPAAVAVDNGKDVTHFGFVNTLNRLGGMDRILTSLAVADKEFSNRTGDGRGARPSVLYITSMHDNNLVDAASAGMLQDGPIAYVANNSYIAEAVGEHFGKGGGYAAIKKVIAIGGEGAISDATLKAVASKLGANVTTGRLGGKDRYETSVAVASRIYDKALSKDDTYVDHNGAYIYNTNTSNLKVVYFANGDNSHVVDSMVGGSLDNGPVLLVQPDGKIPESVKKFIEKTLPEQFAVLGGEGVVPDSTVAEAWIIKTLANKWDTSSNIPEMYHNAKNLRELVYGIEGSAKNNRDVTSRDFMGLMKSVDATQSVRNSWSAVVEKEKAKINKALNDAFNASTSFGSTKYGFYKAVLNGDSNENTYGARIHDALVALYGDLLFTPGTTVISSDILTIGSFKYDPADAGTNEAAYKLLPAGFDFSEIEGSKAYKAALDKGMNDLNKHWAQVENPDLYNTDARVALETTVAKASQNLVEDTLFANSLGTTGSKADLSVSGNLIFDLANYTYEQEKTWLAKFKKQLEGTEQNLRVERDKIAPKTELRLGGKDRFETAALIANQHGNLYGGIVGVTKHSAASTHFTEAYIANGLRMADSLTAGQLSRGPILLVTAEGDLPDFTKTVAGKLKEWTAAKSLDVYGIGGAGVLPDAQLEKTARMINHGRDIPKVGQGKEGSHGSAKQSFAAISAINYLKAGAGSLQYKFVWDGIQATLDGNLKESIEAAIKNVYFASVTLDDGAISLNADNKHLDVDGSRIHMKGDATVGQVKLVVTYNGRTAEIVIDVYKDASAAPTLDSVFVKHSQPAVVAERAAGKKVAVRITQFAKDAELKASAKLTSGAKTTDVKAGVETIAGSKYVVFTIPSGAKKNDTIAVSLTQQEKGKAPSTAATETLTVAKGDVTEFTKVNVTRTIDPADGTVKFTCAPNEGVDLTGATYAWSEVVVPSSGSVFNNGAAANKFNLNLSGANGASVTVGDPQSGSATLAVGALKCTLTVKTDDGGTRGLTGANTEEHKIEPFAKPEIEVKIGLKAGAGVKKLAKGSVLATITNWAAIKAQLEAAGKTITDTTDVTSLFTIGETYTSLGTLKINGKGEISSDNDITAAVNATNKFNLIVKNVTGHNTDSAKSSDATVGISLDS